MRKRAKLDGMSVHAVTGTHAAVLGFDLTKAKSAGLLGFAIEREDHDEHEKYFLRAIKVFKETAPDIARGTTVSTAEHPIQSFLWNDLTAKPERDYTYRVIALGGTPKNLQPINEVSVRVHMEAEDDARHGVWMNRGVAGSQAYARKFTSAAPADTATAQLAWLGRGLDQALLGFIKSARAGDSLNGAVYEFHHKPVLDEVAKAVARGVHVEIVYDAKRNDSTDKHGVYHEAFPRVKNQSMIDGAQLGPPITTAREAGKSYISHNKFFVLSHGGSPVSVWTGSTNISAGGIYGQANVGHVVHDRAVAQRYLDYWFQLSGDPTTGALRTWVDANSPVPTGLPPRGVTTLFSPRTAAKAPIFLTAAFTVNTKFAEFLQKNRSYLRYLLLESRPRADAAVTMEMLSGDRDNMIAVGSHLQDVTTLSRFTIERLTGLNSHVNYVHTKFLVVDPLGKDPIVVTGSANFSDPSNRENDENMLIIRGDTRVADIYLTEFSRLFQHFYFRYVSAERAGTPGDKDPSYLAPKPGWAAKYFQPTSRKGRQRLYFR
jgi:phosphatidylserine/phosphatidylglycerophosphate/cardiolipin synthase-like enzyme